MKRAEIASENTGNNGLFGDILARTEKLRATARMLLGRTAVKERVALPPSVVAAVQTSPSDANKLSFRGWMARRDYRVAQNEPTPGNTLRARQSAQYAAEEAANPDAPINQISSPTNANKATYDWGADSVQAAPAVIGGRFGNSYQHPADPAARQTFDRGVAPMQINNPELGGNVYTQQELDALNQMPKGDGLIAPEQFGMEQTDRQ